MKKYNPDPRTLLFVVAMISSISVLTKHLTIQIILFVIVGLLYKVFNLSAITVIKKIRKMIPILIFVAIAQSIFVEGEAILSVYSYSLITYEGLIAGLMTFFRLLIIIASAMLFTLTNEKDMIVALTMLKVPYEIGMMSMIGLRFLPNFYLEFSLCMESFELKGISFKEQSFNKKIKLIQLFVTPVLIRTILKAKRLAMSMDLKGFKAYPTKTSIRKLKFTTMDGLLMSLFVVVLFVLMYLERSYL